MYILDKCPIKAARYLTRSHVNYYILVIQLTFIKYYKDQSARGKGLECLRFIKVSMENYVWLVEFYKELQELYKKYISKTNSYRKGCKGFQDEMLIIPDYLPNEGLHFPINKYFSDKYLGCSPTTTTDKIDDYIDFNRANYIYKCYRDYDFILTRPYWYSDYIEKEFFSELDDVMLKMVLDREGNFRFFYNKLKSGYIEIYNVPEEINLFMRVLYYNHK